MAGRPRAGMRLPQGQRPVDASVSKEEADRQKAQEDEEFEKFLNEVADGEARLKAREDAERLKDWEETQEYLKQKKEARNAKPQVSNLSTSPTPILPRIDTKHDAPVPPLTRGPSSGGFATSPPPAGLRSPKSPDRRAGGEASRERGMMGPAGFKSPPRLLANPFAPQLLSPNAPPTSPKTNASATTNTIAVDYATKKYNIKHVVKLQALVRRWLVMHARHKKASKQKDHRRNCAKELLETEQQYVKALETAVQVYLEPLQFHYKLHSSSTQEADKPYLTQEQIQTLFANLVSIQQFNQKFCNELAAKVNSWTEDTKLGELFIKWGPFFKIYIAYCNNHEKATHLYLSVREEPRLAAWLETCRLMADPLDSYLIRPVQRVPRYILLLTDLIKHTPKDHPDYNDLVAAVNQTQSIADHINVSIKQSEKMDQMLALQDKLGIKDLVEPSRFFIRTGLLQLCQLDQTSLFKKDIVSYWFFLFNDLILWAERKGESYLYKGRLALSSMRLKDIPDNAVVQNAFHVIAPHRTVTLAAPTRKDKKEWMDCINSAIMGLREITARRGEAMTADAPFLSATIIAAEQREEKGSKMYTTYVIEVTKADGTTEWLERRYSDFDYLHKEIEKRFASYNFTKLPQKHLFGNLKKDIVQGRQVMLETYLQELLSKPDVCKCDIFVRFLSSGAEKRIVSHVKIYDRDDDNASWTIALNQYTTCRDILRSVGRKINVEPTSLALIEVLPHGVEQRIGEDELMQPLKQRIDANDVGQRICILQLASVAPMAPPISMPKEVPQAPESRSLSPRLGANRPSASSLVSPSRMREPISPRGRGSSANQVPGVIPPEMSHRPLPASPLTLERRDSTPGMTRGADSPAPRRVLPPSPRPRGEALVSPLSASTSSAGQSAALSTSPSSSPSLLDRAQSPTPAPLRNRGAVINLGEVHPEPARKPLPVPPGRLHNFPTLPPPVLPPPPAPPPAHDG